MFFCLFSLFTDNQLRDLIALLGCDLCKWVKPNSGKLQFKFRLLIDTNMDATASIRYSCLYDLFCFQVFTRHPFEKDSKYKAGLKFLCTTCRYPMYQDRPVVNNGTVSYNISCKTEHETQECSSSPTFPSENDDSLFGNRDLRAEAFLPALLGAVFISSFPMAYANPSGHTAPATMASAMRAILGVDYGISLTERKIRTGLTAFSKLINTDFRRLLNDSTSGGVNTHAKTIFIELASAITAVKRKKATPGVPTTVSDRKLERAGAAPEVKVGKLRVAETEERMDHNNRCILQGSIKQPAGVPQESAKNNTVATNSGGRSKRIAESDSAISADPVRLEKRIKTATLHTDDADRKTSASSEEQKIFTQVSVFSRPSDFNETTCYMIDLEHIPHITQGATPLVARCMRVYHWPESKTRKILKAYRQFLMLKKIKEDWNAEILSPSAEVDLMWHQHILDVVNYSHDCMLLCGHVVGHNPDGGLDDSARAERREATRAALEEHFGEKAIVDNIWPIADEPRLANPESLTVRIRDQTGEETFLRIHLRMKMAKVFQAYAQHNHVNAGTLRFLLDGERILDDETAAMLGLKDQDQIDCMLELSGC
jgi:hypothetical protein